MMIKKLSTLTLALVSLLWLTGAKWLPLFNTASFSITFGSAAAQVSNAGATYDYGTLTYPVGATRLVVAICAIPGTTQTVTGVTVGGTSLTHVANTFANSGGASGNAVDIWISSASIAGSSGDIQVTYGSTLGFNSAVAVYGLTTTTTTPAFSNSIAAGFGAGPTTLSSVVVPASGGGIVVVNGSSKTFSSWTNAATDMILNASGNFYAFGHTTGSGTLSVSYAWTGGGDQIPMAVATWGP
jgi:hypothetical protein